MNLLTVTADNLVRVFVYETLFDATIRQQLFKREVQFEEDSLNNYINTDVTLAVDGTNYHTLEKMPGHETPGLVLHLTPQEVKKMDDWENYYNRVKVQLVSGLSAWVYVLKEHQATAGYRDYKSDDLSLLSAIIETGEGTYDYLMSSNADEQWEMAQEDGEEDRARWAKSEDRENNRAGNPAHYFATPKRYTNFWIIHFTRTDPATIIRTGFKGKDTFGVGLTTQYHPDAHPGSLAFGFPIDRVEMYTDEGTTRYGQKAVLVLVEEALVAHHYGDVEWQAVFDVKGVKRMYAVYPEQGELEEGEDADAERNLVIYGDDGSVIARCKANADGPAQLVRQIESVKASLVTAMDDKTRRSLQIHFLTLAVDAVIKRRAPGTRRPVIEVSETQAEMLLPLARTTPDGRLTVKFRFGLKAIEGVLERPDLANQEIDKAVLVVRSLS
jgi:hypothetical protein